MKKRAIHGQLSIPSPGNAVQAGSPNDGVLYFPSFSLASRGRPSCAWLFCLFFRCVAISSMC